MLAAFVAALKPAEILALVSASFSLAAAAFFPAMVCGLASARVDRRAAVAGMLTGLTVTLGYMVVNAQGFLLQPQITIPANASALTIGRDGTVTIELVAGGGQQQLGQIQIANFINPAGLKPLGNNLMATTAASGPPVLQQPGVAGAGVLAQGSLEASNVNVVTEMVNMIETQRAYEINSKSIETVDGMLKYLNQNL